MAFVPDITQGGQRLDDALTMKINGIVYDGWKSISVTRNIRALSGSFNFQVSDRWRQENLDWKLKPDDKVQIFIGGGKINGGLVISGFIDEIDPKFDKGSRSLPIQGRDKTADLIDCDASLVAKKTEFKDITLTALAEVLSTPFGIKVLERADVGKPFKKWTIKQGETCFETLDRAARDRQIILTTSPVGNLILEKRGQDKADNRLIQGINIKSGEAKYTNRDRYSQYVVKGQRAGNDNDFGKNVTSAKGEAFDRGVSRFRPLLIIAENPVNQAEAQARAEWEATVRAANSNIIKVVTPKWLMETGRLWQINEEVKVSARFLGIQDETLLISETTFNKTKGGGSICNISLMRRDAFIPKAIIPASGDIQKNLGWSTFSEGLF